MNEVREADSSVRVFASRYSTGYDGVSALNIESLNLHGNVIALVGHNGAGKSTLIKSLLGLLPALDGEFGVVDSTSGCILRPEEDMAFCPETGAVFSDISVKDYVQLWCRIKQSDPNYYKKEGRKYAELLQLEPLMKKLGRELSKGQRRRVQTAVGFFSRPKLFLFDEPFDGLDVQKTSELAQIIREHTSSMSFVVSSHRMDVVERLADKVIVLRGGEVESVGSVAEVCEALSGKSLIFNESSDSERLTRELRSAFPGLLVSQLGGGIRVTGTALDVEAVARFAQELDQNGLQRRVSTPSLVDAMNFHLRELE